MAYRSAQSITAEELLASGLPSLDPETQRGYVRAFEYAGKLFADGSSDIDEATELARDKCRAGNPFPLVARQWPSIVIPPDHRDADIFRRDSSPKHFVGLPDEMQEAILDPSNPLLRMCFWQKIILAGFFCDLIGEVFIKGCTGAGKGAIVGMAINLWFDVFGESRTMCSSESFNHAQANIFGEVSEWRRKMAHPGPGRLLGTDLKDTKRHYVTVLNPKPDSGEAFSGIHGPKTLYTFDEASASPDIFFVNAEKNASKIVALANPRTLSGRFRNAFKSLADENRTGVCAGTIGQRLCVTVGGLDCLNVSQGRLKRAMSPHGGITINGHRYESQQRITPDDYETVKPLIPNQIDLIQFEGIKQNPDQRHVDIFAHGKFPVEDEEIQVILSSWLNRHIEAWSPSVPVDCFGLDVARSLAGDATVLSAGGVHGCRAQHSWKFNDVMYHAREVLRIAEELYGIDLRRGMNPVCIDYGGGYGAGVGDPLREMGVWVIEFQPNGTSGVNPRLYANLRTEGYATLGRRLNPNDQWRDDPWALPHSEDLSLELVTPEKKYSNDAVRFHIEPKESIKVKLQGHSPDLADSLVYLFHAVREFHLLNQYFAAYQGELVVYPAAQPKDGEPVEKEADLLTYLTKQYGNGQKERKNGSEGTGSTPSPVSNALWQALIGEGDDEDDDRIRHDWE
jgi:hypothetical protein